MAMSFTFDVHPFGFHNNAVNFAVMDVVSKGDKHCYTLKYHAENEKVVIKGCIPRERSGHRNFLHMLHFILLDIFKNNELREDYVHIQRQIRESLGDPKITASDYT